MWTGVHVTVDQQRTAEQSAVFERHHHAGNRAFAAGSAHTFGAAGEGIFGFVLSPFLEVEFGQFLDQLRVMAEVVDVHVR
ncbi:hypothetical protein ABHN98_15245 [Pseudomonas syringae]